MNAILNTTEHNATTKLVLRALQLGKERMTVKEVAQAANIRESAVEMMLIDAVEDKLLSRTRHSDGQIVYSLVQTTISRAPESSAAPLKSVAVADDKPAEKIGATVSRPGPSVGSKKPARPELDLSKIGVSLKPLANSRSRDVSESKWGPLFDSVCSHEPDGDLFPTSNPIPREYMDALKNAAAKYSKVRGVKLKVALVNIKQCVVQRIE